MAFYLPPSIEDYLDLYNRYFYDKIKIVKPDGSDIDTIAEAFTHQLHFQ